MLCFPVATLIMAKEAALFTYVIPFFVSSAGGTLIAAIIVPALKKAKIDRIFTEDKKEVMADAGENA